MEGGPRAILSPRMGERSGLEARDVCMKGERRAGGGGDSDSDAWPFPRGEPYGGGWKPVARQAVKKSFLEVWA